MDQPSTELYLDIGFAFSDIYTSRRTGNIASRVLLMSGLPMVGAGETFALLTVVNG